MTWCENRLGRSLSFAYSTFFIFLFAHSLSWKPATFGRFPWNVAEWIHCSTRIYIDVVLGQPKWLLLSHLIIYVFILGPRIALRIFLHLLAHFFFCRIVDCGSPEWMDRVNGWALDLCEFIHKLDYNVYIELTYGDSCKWHISDSFCLLVFVFIFLPFDGLFVSRLATTVVH